MKKFTMAEKRSLKQEGYSDEEILRMEIEAEEDEYEEDDKYEEEEELPTNAQNMRGIDWNRMRQAGTPDKKRAGIMRKK